MADYNKPDFNDRASRAADAKKALLERFKTRPAPDAEAVAARTAAAEKRAQKSAEAKAAREADRQRKVEERLAAEREAVESVERHKQKMADLLVMQKAARDARYAARKKK